MTDPDLLDPRRQLEHPSRRTLEIYAANAVDAAGLEAHLNGCESCRGKVADFRLERASFLADKPTATFLDELRRKAGDNVVPLWRRRALWTVFAAAAAVLLFLFVPRSAQDPNIISLKGGALKFEIFASRGGAPATPLKSRQVLKPGDVLKFIVQVPRDGFVLIVNLDDSGAFTVYYARDGASAPVRGGEHASGPSIELDSFVGKERVFCIYSPTALRTDLVKDRLAVAFVHAERRIDEVALNLEGAEVASVLLRKEAR